MSDLKHTPKHLQKLLNLNKRTVKGRLKIYINGGLAGIEQMLVDGHCFLNKGFTVKVAFIDKQHQAVAAALLEGLSSIPPRILFQEGKRLEEMDTQAILLLSPQVVIIDNLAHSTIAGAKNRKRWQDVWDILKAGIYVLTTVHISQVESLNEGATYNDTAAETKIAADKLLQMADEILCVDFTTENFNQLQNYLLTNGINTIIQS